MTLAKGISGADSMMVHHIKEHPVQIFPVKLRHRQPEPRTSLGHVRCHHLFLAVVLGITGLNNVALASLGQQSTLTTPTAPDAGTVLRQTVRRVRVDVVVTDDRERPVTGLQASDFQVSEDGKPQSIRQFEYHSEENEKSTLPKRPPLPPHTFMNLLEAPERGPLTVVLYDLLNTALGDQLHAHQQMLEFLKKSSGRRIAVFVLGDRLRLVQGFTSDTDRLLTAVNHTGLTSLTGYDATLSEALTNETVPPQPAQRRLPSEDRMTEKEGNAVRAYAARLLDDRVDQTLDAFRQIGRFLEGMPGRKNLIWYSGSFPIAVVPDAGRISSASPRESDSVVRDSLVRSYTARIRTTMDLLNTAEVSVYPIDARGLIAADVPFKQLSLEFSTMDTVSERTGGRAFYNTNGLEEALESATVDGSSYYSLLYAPTNAKYDGALRHISVHLGQHAYHLAYRRSYFAKDLGEPEQLKTGTAEEIVSEKAMQAASQFGAPASHELVFAARVDAVGSPVVATPEQLAALRPYREQAARVSKRKYVPPSSQVMMQQYLIQFGILARQLVFPKSANGFYHPHFSLTALAFSADGETLYGTKSQVEDAIAIANIDSIRENGYRLQMNFVAPETAAVIRLVVRDERNGRTGSMEISLPLSSDAQQALSTQ
ncbi:MAG: hypothetical protein C5B47_03210 [Verrucomicrobia bacterium]|nr:MAG: hypothetical protein C5B47_03210 [Verrucomicrobiota bacterium]